MGNALAVAASISFATSALSTCKSGASETTCTVSFVLPGVNVAFTRPTEETFNSILASMNCLKPSLLISTLYVPGLKKGSEYTPAALDVAQHPLCHPG